MNNLIVYHTYAGTLSSQPMDGTAWKKAWNFAKFLGDHSKQTSVHFAEQLRAKIISTLKNQNFFRQSPTFLDVLGFEFHFFESLWDFKISSKQGNSIGKPVGDMDRLAKRPDQQSALVGSIPPFLLTAC